MLMRQVSKRDPRTISCQGLFVRRDMAVLPVQKDSTQIHTGSRPKNCHQFDGGSPSRLSKTQRCFHLHLLCSHPAPVLSCTPGIRRASPIGTKPRADGEIGGAEMIPASNAPRASSRVSLHPFSRCLFPSVHCPCMSRTVPVQSPLLCFSLRVAVHLLSLSQPDLALPPYDAVDCEQFRCRCLLLYRPVFPLNYHPIIDLSFPRYTVIVPSLALHCAPLTFHSFHLLFYYVPSSLCSQFSQYVRTITLELDVLGQPLVDTGGAHLNRLISQEWTQNHRVHSHYPFIYRINIHSRT